MLHVLVFVVQFLRPDLSETLEFDRAKILSGEVWRVVTMFFSTSQFGRVSPLALVFLYFGVMFVFMVSDGLENAWGTFKTSLFYYAGILSVVVMSFVYPVAIPAAGTVLYGAAFLAFATLYPRVEILLLLVIPVQIRFLGFFAGAMLLLNAISQPLLLPFYLVSYGNYFIWAAIPALKGTARMMEASQRNKRFQQAKQPESEAFHRCEVCQRTDATDRQLEFRVAADGREYCADHLPD